MDVFNTRTELQAVLRAVRQSGGKIGLAPTMGNLHAGHMALVAAARRECSFTLATIFVNPAQFGPGEDFDSYPRTPDADLALLEENRCDAVFVPSVSEMYPGGLAGQTTITVPGLADNHCGRSRPGHFAGVCTIVAKLFNLTMPDLAFFGEKDYQQLQVIRKMTRDLCLSVDIRGVPIVRAGNGLALSSRNSYLNREEQDRAATLYRVLKRIAAAIEKGDRDYPGLEADAGRDLADAGLAIDYFAVCQAHTLEPAKGDDTELVILAAVYLGETRLIDNIRVSLP